MADHWYIVVASSAGGVEALQQFVTGLPAVINASVFIVQHVSPTASSILPDILNRAGHLPAAHASDMERIRPGRIYVAPPDRHLVIHGDRVRVTRDPRENGLRPAADVLFRSAAAHGPRTIGVVLTGGLDDGSAGLIAIKSAGGLAVVQDPNDAMHPSMPRNAMAAVHADASPPLREVAHAVLDLMHRAPTAAPPPIETQNPEADPEQPFTCPDCGGPLTRTEPSGGIAHYSCLIGHRYSEGSLVEAQADLRERVLWTTLRVMRQQALLHRVRAQSARRRGDDDAAEHLERGAAQADAEALLLEDLITTPERIVSHAIAEANDDTRAG